MDSQVALEVAVVESVGPLFRPRRPRLFLWLHALCLPGRDQEGTASALARSHPGGPWAEQETRVTQGQGQAILGLLRGLGIPGRDLRVEAAFDTADTWTKLSVRLEWDGRRFALELEMAATGFVGEDAEGLRALLAKLYGLFDADVGSVCLY